MWLWMLVAMVVAAAVFACCFKIEDDLTLYNIGMLLLKMQLRKRRAGTAKEVSAGNTILTLEIRKSSGQALREKT